MRDVYLATLTSDVNFIQPENHKMQHLEGCCTERLFSQLNIFWAVQREVIQPEKHKVQYLLECGEV